MPNIEKTLAVSTGNVLESDCELLKEHSNQERLTTSVIAYEKGEYGYWIYVPQDDNEDMLQFIVSARKDGFSDPFIVLMEHARKHECQWVMLDRDADVDPELQEYEW